MENNKFINIPFELENLDNYHIRTSIYNSIVRALPELHGELLDIGCGQMPYKNLILSNSKVSKYTGLDLESSSIHNTSIADLLWDGITIPLPGNSVNCAMATEVLEHCHDPKILLQEAFRVLKPGGIFFFTVPFLWPLHEVPFDEYRYTPFAMEKLLSSSGFSKIKINAHGGWDASLAQMIGLWVRRRPFTKRRRKYLSKIARVIIKLLLKKDVSPEKFKESSMITGISGIAHKL